MTDTKSLIQQYFEYQKELEAKYGEKSIVLMMVGSFYEAYGLEIGTDRVLRRKLSPKICEEQIGNLEQISKLLGIAMTKKAKERPLTHENPYMCGFPTYAMPKHLAKLLNARYTVALYDQFDSEDPRKEKERKLTNIYSPSTYVSEEIDTNNILLACYLESFICPMTKTRRMTISAAHIDLSTGIAICYEYMDDQDHPHHVKHEIYKLLYHLNPAEVIFIDPVTATDKLFIDELRQEIKNIMYHVIPFDKKYHDHDYQEAFLRKVYESKITSTKLKPESWKELVGLDNSSDLSACFIQLLQFAYEHDPHIIEKIEIPRRYHDNEILYMNHDATINLNLLPVFNTVGGINAGEQQNDSPTSCFSIVNKTKTKMGERLLKFRLIRPITNNEELEARYNMVDMIKPYHREYTASLKKIIDIDKKYRKLVLGRLQIHEFAMLHLSFCEAHDIFNLNNNMFGIADCKKIKQMINMVTERFDIDIMLDHGMPGREANCFLNSGVDKNIDILVSRVEELTNIFKIFSAKINHFGNDNAIRASLNINPDRQGICTIQTTKRAYDHLQKLDWSYTIQYSAASKPLTFNLKDLVLDQSTQNTIKLRSRLLDKLAACLERSRQQLEARTKQFFSEFTKTYIDRYDRLIHTVSKHVAEIDVAVSSAIVSIENYYVRPKLLVSTESSFDIRGLRHPIIERIADSTEYITNDVKLDNKHLGILLYGLNSAGKSSLLRAIGINIVLAQAGIFCSCDMISLCPYSELFTKISSSDNLFKGQSTFVVEMYCLRDMLQQSGKNSLILCDELTAGTENTSATGIVAAATAALIKQQTQFIFTTHLHGLADFPEITEHPKLSVYHFAVMIENGSIIQNRKLVPGSGSYQYGIEIADALGLPKQFIKMAYEFRQKYQGSSMSILSNKRSRYNSKVIVDHCTQCGMKPCENSSNYLHVHHIAEQASADSSGKITGKAFHKNIAHNLMVLCEQCHNQIHHDEQSR